jgi:hypothetical protein
MEIPYFLKFALLLGVMLSIVPLTGLVVFGNWRQAWEYARDWLRAIGYIVLAAIIMGLLIWPFMPPPP